MNNQSKLFRWVLLGASVVTIVYLVLAAIRENYMAEWQHMQRQYRTYLQSKAVDLQGRELLKNYRIELKQASIPKLNTVDRCVSCHNGIDDPRMVDVPSPHAVHSGDILKNHPVDRFGCTICHHGQGAATNFHDAKAEDAFWDYPLLSREMTQSSCYACHDIERLPRNQVALLREGLELFRTKSCGSCHKLGGRGGTLGPSLESEGAKTKHQLTMVNLKPPHTTVRWHEAHFRDPGEVVTGSQMRNPTVTPREAKALTAFMLAQWPRDIPESYQAPDKIDQQYRALHPQPLTGEAAYRQFCLACHGEGTYGRWDKIFKRFIPAIRGPSLLATATPEYFQTNIGSGRPGTQMPAWGVQAGGLQPAEILALVDYLQAGTDHKTAPDAAGTKPVTQGDVARGAILFTRNCAGCHGVTGRGGIAPELANPTFQQAASDHFIVTTIRNGRQSTAMPSFQKPGSAGLGDAEISDLLAYVRTWGRGPAGNPAQSKEQSRTPGGLP
jgi:cbb3-type cytochrome c oxidase subunit III